MVPYLLMAAGLGFYFYRRMRKVPSPQPRWKRFTAPGTAPLDAPACKGLEGLYTLQEGGKHFGEGAVLKWSYTMEKGHTYYHLSLFCGKEGALIVCQGRRSGSEILLAGYWRKLTTYENGTVQLVVNAADANKLVVPNADKTGLLISGYFGRESELPTHPLRLAYDTGLPEARPVQIIGHRGGGRNMDYFPVSENSLEMIRMASRFGATGIEVDVRLTSDGVPVLLHDSFLSAHTFRNTVYGGLVEKYTLAALKQKELRKGGRVPTLRETLHTVLYETPLQVVWLDIKFHGELTAVRSLQIEFLQKAKELGRDLQILMGLPTKDALRCFVELEDHHLLPSLTEMEPEDVHRINARVWAPQYTTGTPDQTLASMHAAGVKCYVWSLDDPAMIDQYINKACFDGIVTNTPPAVAYQYFWGRRLPAIGY